MNISPKKVVFKVYLSVATWFSSIKPINWASIKMFTKHWSFFLEIQIYMICGWRVGRPNLCNLENLDCTEDLTSTVSQTTLQVSLGGQISQTSKYSFATSYILSFLQFCDILTRSFSNSFTFHHVLSFQTFPVVSPSSPVLNSNHITWQNKTVMQRLIWGNPTTLPLRWEATPPTEIWWKSWG